MDREIYNLREYALSTKAPDKSAEAVRLADAMQSHSDEFHSSKKTSQSGENFVKEVQAAADSSRPILGRHENSRGWSIVRKILITAGIISMYFKGLYSLVTTGEWSIWRDITRGEGKANTVVNTAKEIQAEAQVEKPKKTAQQTKTVLQYSGEAARQTKTVLENSGEAANQPKNVLTHPARKTLKPGGLD